MTRHTYRVTVSGCDDSTHFDMPLSPAELALVKALADGIEGASTYGCQPTMRVEEPGASDEQ